MTDELSFAVELFQALEADVTWQAMILFTHVSHEEFIARKLFAAAFALHVLRLLEEVQVAEDELQLGWCEEMSVKFWFCIIDFERR